MCPNKPDRECFYPHKCEESGCYFVNREKERRHELEQEEMRQREREEQREQEKRQWARLNELLDRHRETS